MYGEIFMAQETARSQIGRIDERVKAIHGWMETLHATVNGNGQPGHEQRIKKLEGWKSWIMGAGAVALLVVGWYAKELLG